MPCTSTGKLAEIAWRRALTRKDCLPLITPNPISWIQARTGLLGPSPAMAWESDCDPCRMHVQVRNLLGVWLRKIGEPASDSPSNLENPTGNNPLAVDIQPRTPEHGAGGITRQELALAGWVLSDEYRVLKPGGYRTTVCRAQYAGRSRDLALQAQVSTHEWLDFLHLMSRARPRTKKGSAPDYARRHAQTPKCKCAAAKLPRLHMHLKTARQHFNARQQKHKHKQTV